MASSDYFIHGSGAETFGLVLARPNSVRQEEVKGCLGFAKITRHDLNELMISFVKAPERSIRTVDEKFDHRFFFYEKLSKNECDEG